MTPPGMLGVLDWGIGGLGFVSALPPDTPVLYLSDAGAPPYGTLDVPALSERVAGGVRFLAARGAAGVVLACNAASSILPHLSAPIPVPVYGILEAGVQQALSVPGTLGIIGGDRTIAAGLHARALEARGREVRVASGQPLSALVEAGVIAGPTAEAAVMAVLCALGPVDALLLACTHYPALIAVFRAFLPGVPLLDPVTALRQAVALPPPIAAGALRVWTTGDPVQTAWAAQRAWGLTVGAVERLGTDDQKPFWRSAPKR